MKFKSFIAVVPLICILFSCESEKPLTYISSMGTYIFGTYSKNPAYDYYYVLDDSCVILPNASSSIDGRSILQNYSNTRVSVLFKWDDATYRRTAIEAEVCGLTIYTINQDIVDTDRPDTLGFDVSDLQDTVSGMWRCGGIEGAHTYLVVNFTYKFSDPFTKNHSVNLSYDSEEPPVDGYYSVMFHHNAKKDPQTYFFTNTAAFVLPHKFQEEGIKGLYVTFRGLDTLDLPVTYRYDYNPRRITKIDPFGEI